MEGSASQIAAMMIIEFCTLLLLQTFKPYKADDDDSLAVAAQVGLFMTSFGSLLMKVNVTGEDSWDLQAFDLILAAAMLAAPAFAVFEVGRQVRRRLKLRGNVGNGERVSASKLTVGGGGAGSSSRVAPAGATSGSFGGRSSRRRLSQLSPLEPVNEQRRQSQLSNALSSSQKNGSLDSSKAKDSVRRATITQLARHGNMEEVRAVFTEAERLHAKKIQERNVANRVKIEGKLKQKKTDKQQRLVVKDKVEQMKAAKHGGATASGSATRVSDDGKMSISSAEDRRESRRQSAKQEVHAQMLEAIFTPTDTTLKQEVRKQRKS